MKRITPIALLLLISVISCGKMSDNVVGPREKQENESKILSLAKTAEFVPGWNLISPSDNSWEEPQVTFRWEELSPNSPWQLDFYLVWINGSAASPQLHGTSWTTTLTRNESYEWEVAAHLIDPPFDTWVGTEDGIRTVWIRPAKPTLSSSYYANYWISLSWNSVPGAVQYKLGRVGWIRGTIDDGWNDMGTSLSAMDYPYEEPAFTSFVPGGFNFAQYGIVAVNSDGVESLESWVSYGVDYGGGGW